jgi:hypothetical protein
MLPFLFLIISHNIDSIIQPIGYDFPQTEVLLSLHVPKCGGTVMRSVFYLNKWNMTYWSLSQRRTGWKSNRLLHGIRQKLLLQNTKIYAEWHVDLNLSEVSFIKKSVNKMVLNSQKVNFKSMIILRNPIDYVISNGAFWFPDKHPLYFINKFGRESLIGGLLGIKIENHSTFDCDFHIEKLVTLFNDIDHIFILKNDWLKKVHRYFNLSSFEYKMTPKSNPIIKELYEPHRPLIKSLNSCSQRFFNLIN